MSVPFNALLISTVLMLCVMAVRPWVRRYVGSHWVYLLWTLPALRLLVPPLPWLPAHVDMAAAVGDVAQAFVPAERRLPLILGCWLAGAVFYFALQTWRYARFMAFASAHAVAVPRAHRSVRIVYSSAVDGPAAGGIRSRTIFLPLDFARRFDAQERRLALAHECMHHRRGDILANLLASFVLSLHWFNPVAHYAYRLFRADQELACDADVLSARGKGCRMAYGRALLKAGGGAPAAFCGLSAVALLKTRLAGLGTVAPKRTRFMGYAGLIGAGFVLIASAVESPRPSPGPGIVRAVAGSPSVDLPASERLGRASYLQYRRELGLARKHAAWNKPAIAATASAQPSIHPPSPD